MPEFLIGDAFVISDCGALTTVDAELLLVRVAYEERLDRQGTGNSIRNKILLLKVL